MTDYSIDPATGDVVYEDGDVLTTSGIENLLYLTIAIEKGTYWADPDLGSEVKTLLRQGEQWPVIVDAVQRALDDLQSRGLLTVHGVSHEPDTNELIIDVEQLATPYRIGLES